LRTFAGGAAGFSSANAGLGWMMVVAGWTGTVTGGVQQPTRAKSSKNGWCRKLTFQILQKNQHITDEIQPC
jgi:hypothetical protein